MLPSEKPQKLPVTQIPAREEKVETGPLKFGDEAAGIYIEPSSARCYATAIANVIKDYDRRGLSIKILEGLIDLLLSIEEK